MKKTITHTWEQKHSNVIKFEITKTVTTNEHIKEIDVHPKDKKLFTLFAIKLLNAMISINET